MKFEERFESKAKINGAKNSTSYDLNFHKFQKRIEVEEKDPQ